MYTHLNASDGLNRRQYGTVDAIRAVLEIVEEAAKGSTRYRHLFTVVTLDVRNAFNSAPLLLVDAALRKKAVPLELIRLLWSYMSERTLEVGFLEGPVSIDITCRVPQGSVLGPLL